MKSENVIALGGFSIPHARPYSRVLSGVDIVCISRLSESLETFGERFVERLFTRHEIEYCAAAGLQRQACLAARFAAKEAALKAFDLSEAGVDWREIEVCKLPSGGNTLVLHGKTLGIVDDLDVYDVSISLSHDEDYAAAVVVALSLSP